MSLGTETLYRPKCRPKLHVVRREYAGRGDKVEQRGTRRETKKNTSNNQYQLVTTSIQAERTLYRFPTVSSGAGAKAALIYVYYQDQPNPLSSPSVHHSVTQPLGASRKAKEGTYKRLTPFHTQLTPQKYNHRLKLVPSSYFEYVVLHDGS